MSMTDEIFSDFIIEELLNFKTEIKHRESYNKILHLKDIYETLYQSSISSSFISHFYTSCCCFGYNHENVYDLYAINELEDLFKLHPEKNFKENDKKFYDYLIENDGTFSYTNNYLCFGLNSLPICYYPQFFCANMFYCPVKMCIPIFNTFTCNTLFNTLCNPNFENCVHSFCCLLNLPFAITFLSPIYAFCYETHDNKRKITSTNCINYYDKIICCLTNKIYYYDNYITNSDETPFHNLCYDIFIFQRITSHSNYLYCTYKFEISSKTNQNVDFYKKIDKLKLLLNAKIKQKICNSSELNETQQKNFKLFLSYIS